MNKNSKILIQGGYGFHNWGDDLQVWNNVRILKEKGFENIRIMSPSDYMGELCNTPTTMSCQTIYPKMIKGNNIHLFQQFCLIEGALANNKLSILNKKYQQLIEIIDNCDVFFFSGSGTINTRHCYGLMVFLTPIMIASYLKKTIVLSGQGFTPMNNFKLEQFIGGILNKVDRIFTRDFQEGYRALKRTKIDMNKVILGIDDAFSSPSKDIILPNNTIGINISCFILQHLYKTFYELAVLLKKNGYNPIFNYFQREQKLVELITKGEFPIYTFTEPKEVVGFHKSCIGTISMRYHSMLLSIAQQTPVINISRDEYQYSKVKAIIDESHIDNISLNFSQTNIETMYSTLMKAIETQPKILKEINDRWRPKANLAIKYLEELS